MNSEKKHRKMILREILRIFLRRKTSQNIFLRRKTSQNESRETLVSGRRGFYREKANFKVSKIRTFPAKHFYAPAVKKHFARKNFAK